MIKRRRVISAVIASMALVMAVASPAFAYVEKGGSITCPSRPTYLHARWWGVGTLIPPWHYNKTVYTSSYYGYWVQDTRPGEYDGGDWSARGSDDLDTNQTYAYCQ